MIFNPRQKSKGFTLIEVLLSVAIVTIIAGIGIPVYRDFQIKNDLEIATTTVAQSMYRAQVLSQGSEGDASWGVRVKDDIGDSGIILFKGSDYATRDTDFDEMFDLPSTITVDGGSDMNEVVFEKFTGSPNSTGDIILDSTVNDQKTLTINSKGLVSY